MSNRKHKIFAFTAALMMLWAFVLPQNAIAQAQRIDISSALVHVEDALFTGAPVMPGVTVTLDGSVLDPDADYKLYWSDNVNAGMGTVHVVGIGQYYGSCTKDFQITLSGSHISLKGNYNGNLEEGELVEDAFTSEFYICPGEFIGSIATHLDHEVYYSLYRLEEETPSLILQRYIPFSSAEETAFEYDFSGIYESSDSQVFMLSYTWVDEVFDYHSGIAILNVASKVAPATTMRLEQISDVYDTAYLIAIGEDGVLSETTWRSSDTTIATVENGVVRFHKSGDVTITCTAGAISACETFTVTTIDLKDALFSGYDAHNNKAIVVYNGIELKEGKDYTLASSVEEDRITLRITGQGLFAGSITAECSLAPKGDLNEDESVDTKDVEYLLMHTLFSQDYPVKENVDYNHDGQVDAQDVEYLLMHTLYPDDYPVS